jgi:hypothetical protein
VSKLAMLCALALAANACAAVPPGGDLAAAVDVKAKLIPQGDYVALALDVTNGNARSALIFADTEVELVDRAGVAHTTDPLHPLITLRVQRALFDATHGTYYQGFHTIDNVIHGGNPDHFVGIFKKGDFVGGRIRAHYYVPDVDSQPHVVKEFRLP